MNFVLKITKANTRLKDVENTEVSVYTLYCKYIYNMNMDNACMNRIEKHL